MAVLHPVTPVLQVWGVAGRLWAVSVSVSIQCRCLLSCYFLLCLMLLWIILYNYYLFICYDCFKGEHPELIGTKKW